MLKQDVTVSVVIPVWNGRQDLGTCLAALSGQTWPAQEIIVVDNHSGDGSAAFVAAAYPQVRLLRNATNLGFGGGCNAGLRQAQGDLLVVLNQDTAVQPHWLAALVAAFAADPAIGVAGSKALYPDGALQHAGGRVDAQGLGIHIGYKQPDRGQFDRLVDVDFVTGASLAMTRHVYQITGGFDEGFAPAYFEDVDLCYQARAAGLRVVYVPDSVLIHKERSAAADRSHTSTYHFQRNRLRFVFKHWPLVRLQDEFLPAERAWLESLTGAEGFATAVHHAYLSALLNLSDLIGWRGRLLGAPVDEVDNLIGILLALRAIHPSRATYLTLGHIQGTKVTGQANTPAPDGSGHTDPHALEQMRETGELKEHVFRSHVPLFGPAIAAFRRQWNRVAAEWSVRAIIQQQAQFNHQVVEQLSQKERALIEAEQQRIQLAEAIGALLECIQESSRESNDLSQEIIRIKRLLEQTRG